MALLKDFNKFYVGIGDGSIPVSLTAATTTADTITFTAPGQTSPPKPKKPKPKHTRPGFKPRLKARPLP